MDNSVYLLCTSWGGIFICRWNEGVFGLLVFHRGYGLGQVDGFHGDLHLADATEEIGDEDASRVALEQVGAAARSGHALALGAYFELRGHKEVRRALHHKLSSSLSYCYSAVGQTELGENPERTAAGLTNGLHWSQKGTRTKVMGKSN